jgi:hypothetical protein
MLALRLAGVTAAWVAGLLFAVHPIHVEAVAGLVGRAESACALAIIVGLWLFLGDEPISRRRGLAMAVCFVVALLSKEQGVLFPLLLAAAYPIRYPRALSADERQKLKYLGVSLCWILVAYLLLRERVASFSWDRDQLDWYVNPLVLSHGVQRLLMPIALLGRYAMLLVFPLHLSIDYGGKIIGSSTSAGDPYLWIGFAAASLWIITAGIAWEKRNFPALFSLLGLALSYGMIGNIVALIGTNFADRLMYLPSVFFLLAIGIALSRFRPVLILPPVAIIVLLGSIRTIAYARLWNNPVALFESTLRLHPQSERAYSLLYDEYDRVGDEEQALVVARRACAAVPDRWEPYVLVIESELALQHFDAARAAAEEALHRLTARDQRLLFIQWEEQIAQKKEEAGK